MRRTLNMPLMEGEPDSGNLSVLICLSSGNGRVADIRDGGSAGAPLRPDKVRRMLGLGFPFTGSVSAEYERDGVQIQRGLLAIVC